MEKLIIQSSEDTPYVELDINKPKFYIKGKSLPEDAYSFYKPIIEWLDFFKKNKKNQSILFELDLEYINTSSTKQIAKILILLQDISKNNNVKLCWYYFEEDVDMRDAGLRFSRLTNLDFDAKSYND